MSKTHHFRGIAQYAEQLMDLAEGRPAFAGRGQKPSNKAVLEAIASIEKCKQRSFFNLGEKRLCYCGWHTKAAARKQARQAQSDSSTSSRPATPLTPQSLPLLNLPDMQLSPLHPPAAPLLSPPPPPAAALFSPPPVAPALSSGSTTLSTTSSTHSLLQWQHSPLLQ